MNVNVTGKASKKLCPDGLVYHPGKGEGEDPCDSIHGVPDKCEGRPERQRPKPGKKNYNISEYSVSSELVFSRQGTVEVMMMNTILN